MQVFVMFLTDVREPACADAGKRHEGLLLPSHPLRQTRTLRSARGFVTSFSALGVRLHSHPLLVPIAQSNVPPPFRKSKTGRIAPAPARMGGLWLTLTSPREPQRIADAKPIYSTQ